MRAYFLCNMYVSGIHTGIQSGHAIEQLWSKYFQKLMANSESPEIEILDEFSKHHKTFICLKGGDQEALEGVEAFLDNRSVLLPWHAWREPGLNNALTAICIIVPEKYYSEETRNVLYQDNPEIPLPGFEEWERNLAQILVDCPLAS